MERKDIEKRIAPTVRKIDHMLARNLDSHMRAQEKDEITMMHGWIIRYLSMNFEVDVYQRDIEKQFGVGRSTVTNILQLMEKKGYLQREAVEKDARLKKLVLAEKGRELNERIEHLVDQLNEETVMGISNEELDVFFKVIEKLEHNIERQQMKLRGKEEADANASNNT